MSVKSTRRRIQGDLCHRLNDTPDPVPVWGISLTLSSRHAVILLLILLNNPHALLAQSQTLWDHNTPKSRRV